MAYEDRTYHGIQGAGGDEDEWQPARLLVERPKPGPTERQNVTVLRELKAKDEDELGGDGWGYNGGGTSRAAGAILADALDLGTPEKDGLSMSEWPQDDTLVACARTSASTSSASSPTSGAWAVCRAALGPRLVPPARHQRAARGPADPPAARRPRLTRTESRGPRRSAAGVHA
ncbi:hypothetical protein ABZ070_32940 [Streptomyces sp. NPDC006283]|uniref:hypothetical protein n=1 Tax=Streptomyces sp. NPDC006283 TaxID=3156741 RepID=UPI0033A9C3C3